MSETARLVQPLRLRGASANSQTVENRRILVVDDNKAIHDDFYKILGHEPGGDNDNLVALHKELFGGTIGRQDEGFDIDSAYQGEEALQRVTDSLAEHRPYAVAFVDVRMPPGWDGIKTTTHLLQADPQLLIVICTAFADYSWDEISDALGATDRVLILKKPFDTIEVRQLAHALQRRWDLAHMASLKMDELSALVDERTRALRDANERLQKEAVAREETLRQLGESHAEIERMAFHDALTGLPNRRLFDELLSRTLASAERHGESFAVLFVDFDNFKRINDSMGHHAADEVLRELAGSLQNLLRAEDILSLYARRELDAAISRLGGDEFAILLPHTRDRHSAGVVAERVLQRLNVPVQVGEHEVFVTASVGIATFPEDGDTAETLIRNADTAMYHAKQLGKAAFQYYAETMNVLSVERLKLEGALRRAIKQERLEIHYQPQLELKSGRIVGAEALLRWNDADLGRISPATFIPLAEETGLILPIGEWVLDNVCRQALEWQRSGLPAIPLALNISGVQFRRQDVIAMVRDALSGSGLSPEYLSVEITETAMMEIHDGAVDALLRLRELGVSLALDDFGTGYSSLTYLKRFPISTVKIDRTFVAEMLTDPATASITEAIVSMAHVLGLRVVAEGVEERGQIELLNRFGCNVAQGFYYSPPVPAARFAEMQKDGTAAGKK